MADIDAGAGTFDRVTHSLAEIAQPFAALYRAFWSLESLPAQTLELCRLRQAQLLGSDLAWRHEQLGLSAQQREELRNWPSSLVYSDAERACLELTEVHTMDARAITDAQADAVKRHYGDVGLVALVQALGVFDALTRLGLIWDLETLELNES